MRVLVAYNQPVLPTDHPDAASEHDILSTAGTIEKLLKGSQFTVNRVGYSRGPTGLLAAVESFRPDVIFNLFEGEADRTETEISNAALLEWIGIPFTGSPAFAIALGRDKIRTKLILQGAGLPTAPFQVINSVPCPRWPHHWPVIVKPACQDSSVGIDQTSVVRNTEELETRLERLLGTYAGPALAEQYLPGREFHVNFIELPGDGPVRDRLRMVPPGEVRFASKVPGQWPIYTYEAKWNEKSEEYGSAAIDANAKLDAPLAARIEEVCREAFLAVGLRDYGRIDIRVTDDGTPYILEVNPNPYLESPILIDGLNAVHIPYNDLPALIVRNAAVRGRS